MDEQPVSVGHLIHSLSDKVNELEALRLRNKNNLQFSKITEDSTSCFQEILEVCGTGKTMIEEIIMVIDAALNICKLGLDIVSREYSSIFSQNSTSLLCIMLTGPYSKELLWYEIAYHRTLKILETLHPSDTNCTGIWQCFVKLQMKCTQLPDESRLSSLCLILKQAASNTLISNDFSKWTRCIQALLKLNKHPLKRSKLSEDVIPHVLCLIKIPELESDFKTDLLNLRVTVKMFVDLSDLEFSLPNDRTFESDSIGGILNQSKLLNAPQSSIFDDSISKKISELRLGSKALHKRDFKQMSCWLELSFSKWKLHQGNLEKALLIMSEIIWSASLNDELSIDYFIISNLMRKVLLAHNDASMVETIVLKLPITHKMVICSHINVTSQKLQGLIPIFNKLIWKILATNELALLYWPLLALVNLVSLSPQPSTCSDLRKILSKINNLDIPRMKSLMIKALKVLLKYCEIHDYPFIFDFLNQLGPSFQLDILSLVSLLPSIQFPVDLMEKCLVKLFSFKNSLLRTQALGQCEIFLRFSPDVSTFERPSLTFLQADLISFLQRENKNVQGRDMIMSRLDTVHPWFPSSFKSQEKFLNRIIQKNQITTTDNRDSFVEGLDDYLQQVRSSDPSKVANILLNIQNIIEKYNIV